jgi:predicted phosphoadenosine phosphosulfate sulfurtransferase
MSEEALPEPVLAFLAPEQSSLPPEEKRRQLAELVVNSVPSQTSQRVYRMGVEQFFDWWGASAAGEAFSRSLMQRYRVSLEARALAPPHDQSALGGGPQAGRGSRGARMVARGQSQ